MTKESFLKTLRAMAGAWQAFEAYSGAHIRTLGLTPPQFDVIATLGNTPGMTCKELGKRTLITKGTLTGILDRLEARKIIRRQPSESDRRSVSVSLTPSGERLFERVFPAHVGHCKCAFAMLSDQELDQATALMRKLRDAFHKNRPLREEA